jgi:hypothetical protein
LAAFSASLTCLLSVVGKVSGVRVSTTLLTLRAAALVLLARVALLTTLLAGLRGSLGIVSKITRTTTFIVCHWISPVYDNDSLTKMGRSGCGLDEEFLWQFREIL